MVTYSRSLVRIFVAGRMTTREQVPDIRYVSEWLLANMFRILVAGRMTTRKHVPKMFRTFVGLPNDAIYLARFVDSRIFVRIRPGCEYERQRRPNVAQKHVPYPADRSPRLVWPLSRFDRNPHLYSHFLGRGGGGEAGIHCYHHC